MNYKKKYLKYKNKTKQLGNKTIPRTFFTFWDTKQIPELVQKCIDTWKKTNPNFEVIIITEDTVKNHVKRKLPSNFNKLTPQKKSNWVRCVAIYEQGGFWMDASTILIGDMEKMIMEAEKKRLTFIGFQHAMKHFQIENWSFAAPKGTQLMKRWIEEYEFALSLSGDGVVYSERFGKSGIPIVGLPYLFHQLCLLRILYDRPQLYKSMYLQEASLTGFYHKSHSFSSSYYVLKNLVVKPSSEIRKQTPFIKITGIHRKLLENIHVQPKSIADEIGLGSNMTASAFNACVDNLYKETIDFPRFKQMFKKSLHKLRQITSNKRVYKLIVRSGIFKGDVFIPTMKYNHSVGIKELQSIKQIVSNWSKTHSGNTQLLYVGMNFNCVIISSFIKEILNKVQLTVACHNHMKKDIQLCTEELSYMFKPKIYDTIHSTKGKFDIIVLDNILERLDIHKFRENLNKARTLLKNNGIIVVMNTSFPSRSIVLKENQISWDIEKPVAVVYYANPNASFYT